MPPTAAGHKDEQPAAAAAAGYELAPVLYFQDLPPCPASLLIRETIKTTRRPFLLSPS